MSEIQIEFHVVMGGFLDGRTIFWMESRNESAISKGLFMEFLLNFSNFVIELFKYAAEGSFLQFTFIDLMTLFLQSCLRIIKEWL
jgi:hypothetical protein